MPSEQTCRITTKDLAILETMLERYRGPCPHFAALLRRKVHSSAVYLRDDIPPGTVTLNSRIAYRVDGAPAGPHLLVQSETADLPDFALSIHSLRGLALLGMSEGQRAHVALPGTGTERLGVETVLSQPEAEFRLSSGVVSLASRRRRFGGGFDDDPGPQAA